MTDQPKGVWITYLWDMGIHVGRIYPTEIEALREAVSGGYQKVAFVEFGMDVSDVDRVV